ADAAASGGTAAVARAVSEWPVTLPTLPATDTARPARVTAHAAARERGAHRSARANEQRELADRDEHVDLERPDHRPVAAQAVPVVAGCGEVGRSDVRLVLELPRLRRLPLQSGDAPLQLADPLLSAAEVLAQPGRQGEGFPRSWLVPSRP